MISDNIVHHDINVILTNVAPECQPDMEDILLGSPLAGKMCPTFDGINSIAGIYGGRWENWDGYCCIYSGFSSKHNAMRFAWHVMMEYPDSVVVKYEPWSDDA